MKRLSLAVFAAFALSAGAASAEVVNRSENGFTLTYATPIPIQAAPPTSRSTCAPAAAGARPCRAAA